MKVIFLDRDGTIIVEPGDQQVDSLEKLELIPGAIHALRSLVDRGYQLVMVTNQDGLGSASFPQTDFDAVQQKLLRILEGEGVRFTGIFVCPHLPADRCACRKPNTGLVQQFLSSNSINLDSSFVLGDRETDVEFGKNLGCKTIRIAQTNSTRADHLASSLRDACAFIVDSERTSHVERITNETRTTVDVNLNGTGRYNIQTGIGFFDHMLEQLSRHSTIDLTVHVEGDLNVDEHHTVEDTGFALGEAIRQALGDKRGIERYGFVLPMDESLAQAVLDLSGRPYLVFEGRFERERVGDLPTELVEDFFRALSDGLRANLHMSVRGKNDHHKIEAMFKAVARSLRQAVTRDERIASVLPSTKGVL